MPRDVRVMLSDAAQDAGLGWWRRGLRERKKRQTIVGLTLWSFVEGTWWVFAENIAEKQELVPASNGTKRFGSFYNLACSRVQRYTHMLWNP